MTAVIPSERSESRDLHLPAASDQRRAARLQAASGQQRADSGQLSGSGLFRGPAVYVPRSVVEEAWMADPMVTL